ncbi:MAG: DUF2948 family protein [Rhodobiaceae bacterium]|nr:DUF2948 family protein [Rhodobiaceae bacterium]MCC0054037.1 DUF2948 family protein [Rhodobiaceae bacterium]
MTTTETADLRLAALDADDLDVISAHMQDAVVTPSDMVFRRKSAAFIAMANRYDWDSEVREGAHRRRRTALHFDRVVSVRARGIPQGSGNEVLNLLAIRFLPGGDEPAGTIELVFSGKAAIRLQVECIEVRLKDMGPVWATQHRPDHEASPANPAD